MVFAYSCHFVFSNEQDTTTTTITTTVESLFKAKIDLGLKNNGIKKNEKKCKRRDVEMAIKLVCVCSTFKNEYIDSIKPK